MKILQKRSPFYWSLNSFNVFIYILQNAWLSLVFLQDWNGSCLPIGFDLCTPSLFHSVSSNFKVPRSITIKTICPAVPPEIKIWAMSMSTPVVTASLKTFGMRRRRGFEVVRPETGHRDHRRSSGPRSPTALQTFQTCSQRVQKFTTFPNLPKIERN